MSLTDARRMWVLLRDAGHQGVHSHDLRRMGVTGNPSQRSKDMADRGVDVRKRAERRGKRPGVRFWLAEFAPSDAERVRPNRDADSDELNAHGHGEARPAPAAVPSSPAAGARVCTFRDYSTEHGFRMGWQRVALDAEGNPVIQDQGCLLNSPRRQDLKEAA